MKMGMNDDSDDSDCDGDNNCCDGQMMSAGPVPNECCEPRPDMPIGCRPQRFPKRSLPCNPPEIRRKAHEDPRVYEEEDKPKVKVGGALPKQTECRADPPNPIPDTEGSGPAESRKKARPRNRKKNPKTRHGE